MTIKVGEKMPEGSFRTLTDDGPVDVTTASLFAGKKVVLFGVPGAFTPTCSNDHLPSYLRNHDKIKAQGFDTIACVAVNDMFVMDAWAKERGVAGRILMLADGNGEYARKLGLELDAAKFGMGVRCKRFSMIVADGVVETLNIDEGKYNLTGAEATCSIAR
jgi:peroxiredoxin